MLEHVKFDILEFVTIPFDVIMLLQLKLVKIPFVELIFTVFNVFVYKLLEVIIDVKIVPEELFTFPEILKVPIELIRLV